MFKKETIKSLIIILASYIFFNLYYVTIFFIYDNIHEIYKPQKIISIIIFILIFIIIPFILNRFAIKTLIPKENFKLISRIVMAIIIIQIILIISTFNINYDFPELLSKKELILSYINKYTMFFLINSLFIIINVRTSWRK